MGKLARTAIEPRSTTDPKISMAMFSEPRANLGDEPDEEEDRGAENGDEDIVVGVDVRVEPQIRVEPLDQGDGAGSGSRVSPTRPSTSCASWRRRYGHLRGGSKTTVTGGL